MDTGYHLENMLWHILAAVLLFLLLQMTFLILIVMNLFHCIIRSDLAAQGRTLSDAVFCIQLVFHLNNSNIRHHPHFPNPFRAFPVSPKHRIFSSYQLYISALYLFAISSKVKRSSRRLKRCAGSLDSSQTPRSECSRFKRSDLKRSDLFLQSASASPFRINDPGKCQLPANGGFFRFVNKIAPSSRVTSKFTAGRGAYSKLLRNNS